MYYIYGHFLDNKCIYIGSNWKTMNPNRAYDLSDRNKEYKAITKNRKQDIVVKILKEFSEDTSYTIVVKEEHNMIKEYRDRGEALCSKEDHRGKLNGRYGKIGVYKDSYETFLKKSKAQSGKNNPMYGKHHTEEARRKMSESKRNLSDETREKYRQANLGKNNPNYGIKRKKINNGTINKYVKLEELEYYLNNGWKVGGIRWKKN